ncbi:hypothetical protein MASR2M78_37570 [Treponema sp.]
MLFLDEAPEFRINVLRALREPLEDGVVTISRAEGSVLLPADFQLILAANPCPCGRLGTKMREEGELSACFCSGDEIARHWRKLGGALLDRIELRVPMTNLLKDEGPHSQEAETSAKIALRVQRAVEIQRDRFKKLPCRRNARMGPALVNRFCSLESQAQQAFSRASEKLYLSGRAQHAALRLARTIADLEGSDTISPYHILEAVEHRRYGDDPYDLLKAL